MNYEEFKDCKEGFDSLNPNAKLFIIDYNKSFYIEPNFYTQLLYVKDHFKNQFNDIINSIFDIVKRNNNVIFTGDFENPVVYKDGFIYREISDVLAENKLSFDNKSNPDSDWKD